MHQYILVEGFLSRNLSTAKLAFITYFRPLLKYNRVIWNNIYLINLTENVQRKLTTAIPLISSLP